MHYSISPDRRTLTIFADETERASLAGSYADTAGNDLPSIHSDASMYDVLEPLICNSELTWIDPSETGDLTDAPMLGILGEEGVKDIIVFLPNHGLRVTGKVGYNTHAVPILERWAFMGYQTHSFLEVLRDNGEIHLTGGPV